MQSEESDLRQRTKEFALRIVSMFRDYLKMAEAQEPGKEALISLNHSSFRLNFRDVAGVLL
jgi:hypothetical protein